MVLIFGTQCCCLHALLALLTFPAASNCHHRCFESWPVTCIYRAVLERIFCCLQPLLGFGGKDPARFVRAAGFQDLFYLQDPELSFEQVSPLQPWRLCLVKQIPSPLQQDAPPSLEGCGMGQDVCE